MLYTIAMDPDDLNDALQAIVRQFNVEPAPIVVKMLINRLDAAFQEGGKSDAGIDEETE